MAQDPYEILGVARDATLAQVDAAYRRIVALFHPDRLQQLRDEVRLEGERRFKEATAAVETLRARLRDGTVHAEDRDWLHRAGETLAGGIPEGEGLREYNAQLRRLGPDGMHATWPGRHAAALWGALRRAHRVGGLVTQVEWGVFECTLPGSAVRTLLSNALEASGVDWRHEPLENLDLGHHQHWHRNFRSAIPEERELELGTLDGLVDDDAEYVVTAEVFAGFD